ncbi:MAG: outer membrane beta-barrel protein [Candidatus Eisenbacteria bacterium]|nr:outer membrane beta-barrel protein [Candidatus Eisenbacteria bacterium]
MRRAVLLLVGLVLLAASPPARSQELEVSALGGYRFGGTLKAVQNNLVTEAAPSFGLTVGYQVRRDMQVEFFYSRQSADLTVKPNESRGTPDIQKLGVEYWHAGWLYELRPPGGIRPYVVVRLGATRFDPIDIDAGSIWRFSGGFGAGVRVFFTESIGVRVEAQLLSTAARRGNYFNYEGDHYVVESTGMHQGSISAGLTMALW